MLYYNILLYFVLLPYYYYYNYYLRGTRVSRHTDSYNIDLALSEGRVFY